MKSPVFITLQAASREQAIHNSDISSLCLQRSGCTSQCLPLGVAVYYGADAALSAACIINMIPELYSGDNRNKQQQTFMHALSATGASSVGGMIIFIIMDNSSIINSTGGGYSTYIII